MWLGKLTALDMTPLGWLGRKTSTQTKPFFQTLLDPCSLCCIPSPLVISLLVPEMKNLNVFYHIGHGGHLGHVIQIRRANFRSPYPFRIYVKFGFDWPSDFWLKDVWRVFPIPVYVKQITPRVVQCFTTGLHTKPQGHWLFDSGEEDF